MHEQMLARKFGIGKASALLALRCARAECGPNLSGRVFNHLSLRSPADERWRSPRHVVPADHLKGLLWIRFC
jgi:hypothetical protein